jgi:hypothetical protein
MPPYPLSLAWRGLQRFRPCFAPYSSHSLFNGFSGLDRQFCTFWRAFAETKKKLFQCLLGLQAAGLFGVLSE